MVNIERFYEVPEQQAEYERKVTAKITEFKLLYPKEWSDELHSDIVKQMVRSEIMCERLENQIHNNHDNERTAWQLAQERVHLRNIYDSMIVNLKQLKELNQKNKSSDIVVIIDARRQRIEQMRQEIILKADEIQTPKELSDGEHQ